MNITHGVTAIGDYAFYKCTGLTQVTLPDGVASIGDYAFAGCTGLESVTIPASVTAIGGEAFADTPWLAGLGEFAVANGILLAYQGEGGDVTIPDGVTAISARVFYENGALTGVTMPESVKTVGHSAFYNCSALTHVTMEGVTEIMDCAFSNCYHLEDVAFSRALTTIGSYGFYYCTSLTEVVLPNRLTEIGAFGFYKCTSLAKVTIPASVTTINGAAFFDCPLSDIYYGGSEADWNAINILDGSDSMDNAFYHYNYDTGDDGDPDDNGDPDTPPEVDISVAAKFTDVDVSDPDNWYALPVAWAVVNGITQGTSETEFSPEDSCTRAQIVTFLYRAAGEPDVDKNGAAKFTDVDLDEYYAPAVAWAVENNITVGTTETTFSPEDACTRAQIVTFLWRYEGEPEAPAANVFTDVPAGGYYAAAVNWAVENNITVGTTETTFAPEENCTRAQIVTFLYRDMAPAQTV